MHQGKLLNFTKEVSALLNLNYMNCPIINNNTFEKIYDVNAYLEPNSTINILKSEKILNKNIKNDNDITYILNNDGFRSDNFVNSHNGLHILFAGCSETFGVSSPIEETWSKILYNEISKNNNVSGYFNIGHPSAGITVITYQIFNYIKKYGSPDYLFVLFPNIDRRVSWVNQKGYIQKNGKTIGAKESDTNTYLNMIYDNVFMYKILELVSECLNIKLIYANFDNMDFIHIKKIANSLQIIDINNSEEFEQYVGNLPLSNKDIFIRRDMVHRGIAFHKFWSHKFLLKFQELMI